MAKRKLDEKKLRELQIAHGKKVVQEVDLEG